MSHEKTVFIFIGPPGSGKGSLSKMCVHELGWKQLSTGDLCRKHITKGTEIGKQIDFAIKSGKLVTDDLIVEMVDEWLEECFAADECVILDGFPRTVPQAEALGKLMKSKFNATELTIARLLIEDDQVVARLSSRYICKNDRCQAVYSLVKGSDLAPKKHMVCDACSEALIRRDDDTEESVRERLKTYHKHENKLIEFYRSEGKDIIEFCVEKPLDAVFDDFKTLMGLDSA
ncbi:adenylate kinase family protein [Candidatus Dependentiae bacterium]